MQPVTLLIFGFNLKEGKKKKKKRKRINDLQLLLRNMLGNYIKIGGFFHWEMIAKNGAWTTLK